MTALAGAVSGGGTAAAAAAGSGSAKANGKYNFDEVYDRVGSNCFKYDGQIAKFGEEYFNIGMGVADMDFRVAPCITEALKERAGHENWGYLANTDSLKESIVQWNKTRYGVDIDPDTITMASGVHNALISSLNAISPPGQQDDHEHPHVQRFLHRPAAVAHAGQR